MPELRIKVNSPILPIFPLKLVAMAMSIELSEKPISSVIYEPIPTNVENLVKIGVLDAEIALLKDH